MNGGVIRVTVESTGQGDLLHVTARQASPRLLPLSGVGLSGCGSLLLAGFLSEEALSPLWFFPALIVLVGLGGAVTEVLALRRRAARHAALLEKLAEELPVLLSPTEE